MNIITNSVLNTRYASCAENTTKRRLNNVRWIEQKNDSLETAVSLVVRLVNKGRTRNICCMC